MIYKSEFEYMTNKISELIKDNNQKDIIILRQKKHIENLELKFFSENVPLKIDDQAQLTTKKNRKHKKVNVTYKSDTKITLKGNLFKRIVSSGVQNTLIFCGKFTRSEHSKRKLRKLTTNPYAYFADSRYVFLRPFCKLFDN